MAVEVEVVNAFVPRARRGVVPPLHQGLLLWAYAFFLPLTVWGEGEDTHSRTILLPCPALPCPALPCPAGKMVTGSDENPDANMDSVEDLTTVGNPLAIAVNRGCVASWCIMLGWVGALEASYCGFELDTLHKSSTIMGASTRLCLSANVNLCVL
jgi:hypothetical protein